MSRFELDPKRHGLKQLKKSALGRSRETVESEIQHLQIKMLEVQQAYVAQKRRGIILFEGWDAAGKGGAIRRLIERLDQRHLKVWPIGAPEPQEQGVHYLYRFWTRLPARGTLALFDRSWYGRVLVERVDQLIPPPVWKRAYSEINEFERMLVDDGVHLIKFFLHVSRHVQRQRLEDRMTTPYKRWKLSLDDFRNLSKRRDYRRAIDDMLDRTWTKAAPWVVLDADDKTETRCTVLRTVTEALSRGVDTAPAALSREMKREAKKAFG